MKSTLKTLAAPILVTGLIAASPALGSENTSLPPVQAQDTVHYVSGGIGEDEAAAFKRAAPGYALEMLFVQEARPRDEYLADVTVSIRNRSGSALLATTAEGPFLLAELPAGKYQIDAEFRGERKHRTVVVRPGVHRRAVFVWARHYDAEESDSSGTG
jgi:hypothetical protein